MNVVLNEEILPCDHQFHYRCIDRWCAEFEKRIVPCPNCRRPFKKKFKYTNPPDFVIHFDDEENKKIAGQIVILMFIVYITVIVSFVLLKKYLNSDSE